jgi:hypothetical protein
VHTRAVHVMRYKLARDCLHTGVHTHRDACDGVGFEGDEGPVEQRRRGAVDGVADQRAVHDLRDGRGVEAKDMVGQRCWVRSTVVTGCLHSPPSTLGRRPTWRQAPRVTSR